VDALRISWFFGFGWPALLTVIACGVGINTIPGLFGTLLYIPFIVLGVYMTVRFRLYTMQAWRRVHAKAMIAYGRLAGAEYDAAKRDGRPFDASVPCRGLADVLFGSPHGADIDALVGEGRKAYYRTLVDAYPQVFVEGIASDKERAALDGVRRDIDACELGPDVLIARAIEQKKGKLEAAKYLHQLLLGQVR